MPATDKPDLSDANNTDEIFYLAWMLTWWGLRNGECDELTALDWVLSHPHEEKLERGSHGLNPTLHHIRSGVKKGLETYEPSVGRPDFGPIRAKLQALTGRVSGSGVRHEAYLLGAIALAFKHETLTPVITGPGLYAASGVGSERMAGKVLKLWSSTLAYGFFTGVTWDGEHGHGRCWRINPDWSPVQTPKHLPGCNRSKARCKCPGMSQNGSSISNSCNDRCTKVRHNDRLAEVQQQFEAWLTTLKKRHPLDARAVATRYNLTGAEAAKLLRGQQGKLLDSQTYKGGFAYRRQPDGRRIRVRVGETWFVGHPTVPDAARQAQPAVATASTFGATPATS